MAVLHEVWVPTVVVAHILGVILLLYSLEKVNGIVSKAWKRLFCSEIAPAPEDALTKAVSIGRTLSLTASATSGVHHNAAFGIETPKTSLKQEKTWIRGCDCQSGCSCPNRWVRNPDKNGKDRIGHSVPLPADLMWTGVACSVLDRSTLKLKQVLQPCSGIALPGETMAILGPSGAGKSTLLDILSERKSCGRVAGQVLMNGRPCGVLFRRISAYVAQEDVFVPTMTAWETLIFHATLTLPKAINNEERTKRMVDVLQIMGLSRSRHTQVGGALPGGIMVRGLSGGEKRRLNIACALISSPSILFLDEPTTGLDSFAALNVMEHMGELANVGHTVIASIHQPRSAIWEMFHKVTVLSEGYQLYFGRPEDALYWFGTSLGFAYNLERDGAVVRLVDGLGLCRISETRWIHMPLDVHSRGCYYGLPCLSGGASAIVPAIVPQGSLPRLRQPLAVSTPVGGYVGITVVSSPKHFPETSLNSGILKQPHVGILQMMVTGVAQADFEALAEVEANSPKAVVDQLSWASGRYAAR
eukprot:jgi/Botrbrau1/2566/Bobra.0079s0051.1